MLIMTKPVYTIDETLKDLLDYWLKKYYSFFVYKNY